MPRWLIIVYLILHIDGLPGRDENQSSGLVIIIMTAIFQVAAFHILQKDTIQFEVHFRTCSFLCLRKIDYTHQRMMCFVVVESIVFTDRIKIKFLFHSVMSLLIQT
ncbi:hypothetical protein D3C85_1190060 [compost metagenome]